MSLKPTPFDPVPDTTARIARAAFPKGNPYLSIRDELGAAHGLRRCRYIGMAKTHLQHLLTAVAINLKRLVYWLEGRPMEASRTSRFAQLMQPLSA